MGFKCQKRQKRKAPPVLVDKIKCTYTFAQLRKAGKDVTPKGAFLQICQMIRTFWN